MKIPLLVVAAAALALTAPSSQATVINSAYTPLGANSWLVDFTIINDGTPASFAGFTIDFPNATNLVLRRFAEHVGQRSLPARPQPP